MYKKLIKNLSLISLGALSSKVISYLMIPLYTNVLSTIEYGTTDLIFTTVSLLMPLLSLEISNALMRFLLDKEYNQEKVFSTCLSVLFISVIVFLVFSPILLCFNVFKNYYLLFIFYYLSNLFNGFAQSFSRGVDLVKEYSIAGILQTFFVVIFNVLFLLVFRLKITGYLLAYTLGALVSVIYLINACIKKTNIHIRCLKFRSDLTKEILMYAVPLVPNSVLWWISNSSDKYFLTLFSGVSDVGIYSVAYKIPTILSVFSSLFITAWQISSVEDFGSEKTTFFFQNIARKYLYLNILVTSILLLFLKQICGFLFLNDFYSAWTVVPFLVVGYVYYSMSLFIGTVYTAAKKTKMVMTSTIVGSVVNIILNYLLIPLMGMYGAAIATAISYVAIYLMRKLDSRHIIDLCLGFMDLLYGLILVVQSISLYIDNYLLNVVCFVIVIFLFVMPFRDVYGILSDKIRKRGN